MIHFLATLMQSDITLFTPRSVTLEWFLLFWKSDISAS